MPSTKATTPAKKTAGTSKKVAEKKKAPAKVTVLKLIKNDPYLNAVQVKFAYSLTCHKTQGGQWRHVLVDQGYLTEENLDKEYVRWLYTAVTRSTDKVYLINFEDKMFE